MKEVYKKWFCFKNNDYGIVYSDDVPEEINDKHFYFIGSKKNTWQIVFL